MPRPPATNTQPSFNITATWSPRSCSGVAAGLNVPRVPPSGTPASAEPASGTITSPHTFGIPEQPQPNGAAHEPQFRAEPQPSGTVPQFLPCAEHVVGVQPQTF